MATLAERIKKSLKEEEEKKKLHPGKIKLKESEVARTPKGTAAEQQRKIMAYNKSLDPRSVVREDEITKMSQGTKSMQAARKAAYGAARKQ